MDGKGDDQFWTDQANADDRRAISGAGRSSVIEPLVAPPVSSDVLAGALETLPYGVGVLTRADDDDFRWAHVNAVMARLLGNDAAGRLLTGDAAHGGAGAALADLARLACTAGGAHERALAFDGGRRRVRAQAFGDADPPDRLTVTVSDFIADFAAMRSVDPLRQALEHSSDAVALFDAEGRLVDATSRLKDLFPEIADILKPGAPISELLSRYYRKGAAAGGGEADADPGAAAWRALRLAGHAVDGGEITFRSLSGRWLRNSEWSTTDGGTLSIYTDVTAFKEQEERLRESEAAALEAQRQAEKASRAKSEFLTHMSHEFRTPLNAVIGFAELMELETLGPVGDRRYLDYARDILDSGRRLLELVDDALNLSNIDAGRIKLVEELVDVAAAVAAVVAKAGDEARERKITLTLDTAENAPPLVADRRAFHQMIDHVLSNALKFTPPGGTVLVAVNPTPDGGLGVMIADTGSGIAPDDLEKVLTPFGRIDMSAQHRVDGAGLGLPVVKRIIELHGGDLAMDSEPGVGTTVILTFPPQRVVSPNALSPPKPMVGA